MRNKWAIVILPIFAIYFIRFVNGAPLIDFTTMLEIFHMEGVTKETLHYIFQVTEKQLVQTFNPWIDVIQAEGVLEKILAFIQAIKNTIVGMFQLGLWGLTIVTYIGKTLFGQVKGIFTMAYELLGFR